MICLLKVFLVYFVVCFFFSLCVHFSWSIICGNSLMPEPNVDSLKYIYIFSCYLFRSFIELQQLKTKHLVWEFVWIPQVELIQAVNHTWGSIVVIQILVKKFFFSIQCQGSGKAITHYFLECRGPVGNSP